MAGILVATIPGVGHVTPLLPVEDRKAARLVEQLLETLRPVVRA